MTKTLLVLFVACGLQMSAHAQENSPYSRYGLGDLTPPGNALSRGMGGLSAAIATSSHQGDDIQTFNFMNPASSASNRFFTILDVGTDISYRILKSSSPAQKFTSANTYVSYLQLAFPLTTPKMTKKGIDWSMNFGLRPISKINYKIEKNERLAFGDSLNTLYEGSGGANLASIGTAMRYKNLSFGLNLGYMFGNKDYSTKLTIINDSAFHYISNHETRTSFGGLFLSGGLQYELDLDKNSGTNGIHRILRFGLYGNMQQNLNAKADKLRETIFYDENGQYYRLDSVYEENDIKGKIKYPAKLGFGFIYHDLNWMAGMDFDYGNWANYRYYGQTDQVQNNWTIRVGAQYHPRKENTPTTKYFRFVKYRAGFYYGSDYINVNKNRPEYGFTLGTGMPLTSIRQRGGYGGKVVLNTGLEFGSRGNKQTNLRENVVRFSIGVSMNALWFQKPKYN
jgi:hypothetical protein